MTSPEQTKSLARTDDLPQLSREYYLSIVTNYPDRLKQCLDGFGWSKEKLFSEAEKTFSNEQFPGMSSEEKAATLLWQMENRAKEEFKSTASTMRTIFETFLPVTLVDKIFDIFKTSV